MTKTEIEAEALDRARNGETWTNYPAIFAGFIEKGIAESEIKPERTCSRSMHGKPWGVR
jgi:hypothetical protein